MYFSANEIKIINGRDPKIKYNWICYNEAKEIMKAQGIKTSRDYYSMGRELRLSLNLPANPDKSYKGKGWESWAHFLENKGSRGVSQKIVSFEDARQIVKKLGIKYESEYRKLSKEERSLLGLPYNPRLVYNDKGWINNHHFYSRRDLRYIVFATSFERAKEIVKELGIKSRAEYLKLTPVKRMEVGLPSHPDRCYKNKGWKGWDDFLGKNKS